MCSGCYSEDCVEVFIFLILACVIICPQVVAVAVAVVVAVVAVGGVLTPRDLRSRSSHQVAAKSAQSSKPETRF